MIGNAVARFECAGYKPAFLSALLLAIFSACAWSQTQLATISGTITDPSGAVIPAAAVTVVNQSTGLKREVLTGTAGEYRFAGLPTGNYTLRIEKAAFQTQVREGIALTSASEATVNLSLAVGGRQEQVTVGAKFTDIDNTTSTVGGLLQSRA